MCAGKWPMRAKVLPIWHRCSFDGQPWEPPGQSLWGHDLALCSYPKLTKKKKKSRQKKWYIVYICLHKCPPVAACVSLLTGLTSVLGAVSCDGVDWQVRPDVTRTNHAHTDPAALDLGAEAVEIGLGGVFRCCICPQCTESLSSSN